MQLLLAVRVKLQTWTEDRRLIIQYPQEECSPCAFARI